MQAPNGFCPVLFSFRNVLFAEREKRDDDMIFLGELSPMLNDSYKPASERARAIYLLDEGIHRLLPVLLAEQGSIELFQLLDTIPHNNWMLKPHAEALENAGKYASSDVIRRAFGNAANGIGAFTHSKGTDADIAACVAYIACESAAAAKAGLELLTNALSI